MKTKHFSMTLQIDPYLVEEDFPGDIYDFYKRKMWNVAISGIPLKWYKRTNITPRVYQKNLKVLLYVFLFLFAGLRYNYVPG